LNNSADEGLPQIGDTGALPAALAVTRSQL
jgi:hypothetical protein